MFLLRLASLAVLVFATSHLWVADAASPQTLRCTILSNGTTAGREVGVYNPIGRIDCTFEFNDRGRGPKVAAHSIVAADRLPLRTDVTGDDCYKAPVGEHSAVEGGSVQWKSVSETGRAATTCFVVFNNEVSRGQRRGKTS